MAMRGADQPASERRIISTRSRTRGGIGFRRKAWSSSRVASSIGVRIILNYRGTESTRLGRTQDAYPDDPQSRREVQIVLLYGRACLEQRDDGPALVVQAPPRKSARGAVSSGAVEALNNKVKLVTRKSYGFRTSGVAKLA
ncbi:transposase [Singulisphaera sp. GP187]|uniref:transposase n=1 Tax=Singulisphaera sp. GP187 TaxID=1882752 RepID=UPI001160F388